MIADPPVSEIRACVNALFNVTYQSDSGSFTAPAQVDVEASVPESTAPPPEVGAGG